MNCSCEQEPAQKLNALLLSVLKNLFNLMGIGSFVQMIATGVILVLALVLNKLLDSRALAAAR